MDVWQASLMRAFAAQLAREHGDLEGGEGELEAGGSGSGSDEEGWEWPDEEAAAEAGEEEQPA